MSVPPAPSSRPLALLAAHALVAIALFVGLVVIRAALIPRASAAARSDALVAALAKEHRIAAAAADVAWGASPAARAWPFLETQAWLLGQPETATDDVWSVRARLSPEGALLSLGAVYNLTQTRSTSEHSLSAHGPWVAWASGDAERVYQVNWLQFDRSPLEVNRQLSWTAAWQWRLTWLERLGALQGATLRSFKLVPPAPAVRLGFDHDHLVMRSPAGETRVPRAAAPDAGGRYVTEQTQLSLPRPGGVINWAVDRVRQLPWFGDENMQRLKAVAYRGLDWVDRHFPALLRGKHADYALTVALPAAPAPPQNAALARPAPEQRLPQSHPNWPPHALTPMLSPAIESEGVWLSLDGDPFIRHDLDGHVPFVTTFLRTDEERQDSRVTLTAWDPADVELHMMSGTEEPKSATFETGSGLVPREPEVLDRYVAAFNGGFQSTHGEFGMMVNRTVYAAPRAYAATVAELSANIIGFGVWPNSKDIPSNLVSFRQNLTPLVFKGKYNPYHREWWGGVPAGWEDDTRTVRSGLCATQTGHLIYFYGSKVDPRSLGTAMLRAECTFGMHLDMNQGHTGLEFYHVAKADELPPLGLRLDSVWQAEGAVEDAPGYRFRGRRLFRAMQLMNFPRYVQRETRDFFYLTLRRRLPSQRLASAAEDTADEGVWQVPTGAGSPPVVATTSIRSRVDLPESRVRLVEIDPWRTRPATPADGTPLVAWAPSPALGWHLWWHEGTISLGERAPAPDARALFSGTRAPTPQTRAAVGRKAHTGFLLLAEVVTGQTDADASLLTAALERASTKEVVYLEMAPTFNILGSDMAGHPAPLADRAVGMVKAEIAPLQPIFLETPVVSPAEWQPLQRRSAAVPQQ